MKIRTEKREDASSEPDEPSSLDLNQPQMHPEQHAQHHQWFASAPAILNPPLQIQQQPPYLMNMMDGHWQYISGWPQQHPALVQPQFGFRFVGLPQQPNANVQTHQQPNLNDPFKHSPSILSGRGHLMMDGLYGSSLQNHPSSIFPPTLNTAFHLQPVSPHEVYLSPGFAMAPGSQIPQMMMGGVIPMTSYSSTSSAPLSNQGCNQRQQNDGEEAITPFMPTNHDRKSLDGTCSDALSNKVSTKAKRSSKRRRIKRKESSEEDNSDDGERCTGGHEENGNLKEESDEDVKSAGTRKRGRSSAKAKSKVERETYEMSSGPFNGEQRLEIQFESYGCFPTLPVQKLGGKEGIIPDDIAGQFSMYGEHWGFRVKYETRFPDHIVDKKKTVQLVSIRWIVTNLTSNKVVSMVETMEDVIKRETRGISLCNKVFVQAMELRAKDYEEEIEIEKAANRPNQLRITNFRSKAQSLRPQRVSEGPLLFGLRHKIVQDKLSSALGDHSSQRC